MRPGVFDEVWPLANAKVPPERSAYAPYDGVIYNGALSRHTRQSRGSTTNKCFGYCMVGSSARTPDPSARNSAVGYRIAAPIGVTDVRVQ